MAWIKPSKKDIAVTFSYSPTRSATSCNPPLKKGATEPGTPPGGLHGLRDLGSVELTSGDRMVMVLVSDGDRMVMLLVGDGNSMVMVLVGHADRMVMVLVGDGYRMVTVLVEGGDW